MGKEFVDLSGSRFAATSKDECKNELAAARWAGGFKCPGCGGTKAYRLKCRDVWQCANRQCRKQVSATAGTQFHNSRTLEKIWPVLRDVQHTAAVFCSTTLAKAMEVSAETARRAAAILKRSFRGTQKQEHTSAEPRLSGIAIMETASTTLLAKDYKVHTDDFTVLQAQPLCARAARRSPLKIHMRARQGDGDKEIGRLRTLLLCLLACWHRPVQS